MFTEQQKIKLQAPLSADHVKQREQAGRKLSYIEGWHAIAEANRIFGFDGWQRFTIDATCVAETERTLGKGNYQKPGWGVTYIAKVRVIVGDIVREGVGSGHGIDADKGQAHESAIKEAETDAMKRALMTFGNQFGLALYDKTLAHVTTETPEHERPLWDVLMDELKAAIPNGKTAVDDVAKAHVERVKRLDARRLSQYPEALQRALNKAPAMEAAE